MNNITTVEQILYGYFIKFEKMKELTAQCFSKSNSENINVYIDMYDMMQGLFRPEVRINNYSVITSSVINLCAHIRDYFRRVHRVECRIFIVFSPTPIINQANSQFYCDYNYKNIQKIQANPKIWDMINSNIPLIALLTKYLNDIFFITRTTEASVVIYDTILKENQRMHDDRPHLIITKDIMAYQIAAMIENAVIYRPMKYKGNDTSFAVTHPRVIADYICNTRESASIDPYVLNVLNPELLSLIMSITNVPSRSIKSVYNIRTAINMILTAIQNMTIQNSHIFDINSINQFQPINSIENLANRYKAIDLIYQHAIYSTSPANNDESYLINLIDDDAVRGINNEYFKNNPLDLNRL